MAGFTGRVRQGDFFLHIVLDEFKANVMIAGAVSGCGCCLRMIDLPTSFPYFGKPDPHSGVFSELTGCGRRGSRSFTSGRCGGRVPISSRVCRPGVQGKHLPNQDGDRRTFRAGTFAICMCLLWQLLL